jgi:hypothetical protein
MIVVHTLLEFIINSYNSKRLWGLFFGVCAVAVLFGILGIYIGIGQPLENSNEKVKLLDVIFNYSNEQAYQHIKAYGKNGRNLCLFGTLVLDSIFPLAYGSFFAILLARLFKDTNYKLLILLPLLLIIVDYVENTHIALLLINFPEEMPLIAYTGSICTSIKWILMALVLMSISLGFFLKNTEKFRDTEKFRF